MPKELKAKKTKKMNKKVTRIAGMEGGARIKDMSDSTDTNLEPNADTAIAKEKGIPCVEVNSKEELGAAAGLGVPLNGLAGGT